MAAPCPGFKLSRDVRDSELMTCLYVFPDLSGFAILLL